MNVDPFCEMRAIRGKNSDIEGSTATQSIRGNSLNVNGNE
jgi:hypothetical protein